MGFFGKLMDFKSNIGSNIDKTLEKYFFQISDEDRLKLQSILVEIYDDMDYVAKKLNIKLYLIGGSALGAVRHEGFIPWDDDLDVAIYREDYLDFINRFFEEFQEKYVINGPNIENISSKAQTRFTKIMLKNTTFREIGGSLEGEQGIFIDLFILENAPNNSLIRLAKGLYCNCLEFISSQVFLRENMSEGAKKIYKSSGNINYIIRRTVGFLFSFRSASDWFDIVDKSVRYKPSNYIAIATGRKHYLGEIFEKEDFFPGVKKIFCNREVNIFSNYDKYLKNLYGNYMEIPPASKREKHFISELRFTDADK